MVFTRSAITQPKVNRFGWNLEQCEPNVGEGGWLCQILGAICTVVTVWEWSSFQKRKNWLTKFPGLATSGRQRSAMITDHRKFTFKWSLYGMSVRINKVFPMDCTFLTRNVPTQTFGNERCLMLSIKTNSTLQCWCGLVSYVLKKSRLKISNTASITQSQAHDTEYRQKGRGADWPWSYWPNRS